MSYKLTINGGTRIGTYRDLERMQAAMLPMLNRVDLFTRDNSNPKWVLAFYKDGPLFETAAVDEAGRPRPEWAAALRTRPLRTRRIAPETLRAPGWAAAVRRMAAALDPSRRPVMLVGLLIGP